jgi:rhodanese-related sulfurtransferase
MDREAAIVILRRVLLVAGLLAPLAATPHRQPATDVSALAKTIAREEDHVTALELAAWLRDRKAGLRIIDLRSPEAFEEYRVPRSENADLEALMRMRFQRSETIVLISDGGAHAAQAWMLLRVRDGESGPPAYFLRNGVYEWLDDVMNPRQPSDLTRYFGGAPRIGDDTQDRVREMRRRGC